MAPQIRILSDKYCSSRSRVNMVMDACTEAKEVGLALQLDYFLVGYQIPYQVNAVVGTIKNYVNLDVDTIWLTHGCVFSLLPDDVQLTCGKCHVNDRWGTEPCCIRCLSEHGGMGPESVRCMAIDFRKWTDPSDEEHSIGI